MPWWRPRRDKAKPVDEDQAQRWRDNAGTLPAMDEQAQRWRQAAPTVSWEVVDPDPTDVFPVAKPILRPEPPTELYPAPVGSLYRPPPPGDPRYDRGPTLPHTAYPRTYPPGYFPPDYVRGRPTDRPYDNHQARHRAPEGD